MTKVTPTVTLFQRLKDTNSPEHVSVQQVLACVRDGTYKVQVEAIRAALGDERRRLKEALPGVCFSGTFTKRANDALQTHSGLLCLDFDKVPPDELEALRSKLQEKPYTFAVFRSPSGDGLKALARIPTDKERHRAYFNALAELFPSLDKSGKDPARLCFLSWDPELYVNLDAVEFTIPTAPMPSTPATGNRVPPFPIQVFPDVLANYARELHRFNNFPLDYTGAGFLFAASVAIGNTAHVKVKEEYIMPAVLWLALVGSPGTSKTHPLEATVRHLKHRDADAYDKYKSDVVRWDQEEGDRRKRDTGEAPSPRPQWRPHLVGDTTMEALVGKLEHAPRGLGLHRDELAGWWGSMDQYRRGADREKWLSLFNGSAVDAIRKNAGEVLVPQPFVSVCGTVQPGKLYTLGKDQDGFLPRILFAYPDDQTKPYHSERSIGKEWALSYAEVLDRLLGLPLETTRSRPAPHILELSEPAHVVFIAWERMNTDRTNAATNEGIKAIYPKLETYVPRLALVLDLLHEAAAGNGMPDRISGAAMKGALELVEYFAATALKVYATLNEEDPLGRIPDERKRVYDALLDNFNTGEGVRIAEEHGMSRRTFMRFLKDERLFRREGHGMIAKLC